MATCEIVIDCFRIILQSPNAPLVCAWTTLTGKKGHESPMVDPSVPKFSIYTQSVGDGSVHVDTRRADNPI